MSESPFDLRYASRDEHTALDKRVAVLESRLEMKLDRISEQLRERNNSTSALDNLSLAIQRSFDAAPKGRSQPVTMMGLGAALVVVALYFLKVQPW